jgi:hypothetical protein
MLFGRIVKTDILMKKYCMLHNRRTLPAFLQSSAEIGIRRATPAVSYLVMFQSGVKRSFPHAQNGLRTRGIPAVGTDFLQRDQQRFLQTIGVENQYIQHDATIAILAQNGDFRKRERVRTVGKTRNEMDRRLAFVLLRLSSAVGQHRVSSSGPNERITPI